MFIYVLKNFWEAREPPSESSWNRDLRNGRNGRNPPYGLSAKTTRKTLESWCVASGTEVTAICLRQGRNSLISMLHYQGLAFNDSEFIIYFHYYIFPEFCLHEPILLNQSVHIRFRAVLGLAPSKYHTYP
jgi:hypothetical protein